MHDIMCGGGCALAWPVAHRITGQQCHPTVKIDECLWPGINTATSDDPVHVRAEIGPLPIFDRLDLRCVAYLSEQLLEPDKPDSPQQGRY